MSRATNCLHEYWTRGYLPSQGFLAGQDFVADLEAGEREPAAKTKAPAKAGKVNGHAPAADHVIDARRRFETALARMPAALRPFAIAVLRDGEDPAGWVQRNGLEARHSLVLLRATLRILGETYRR